CQCLRSDRVEMVAKAFFIASTDLGAALENEFDVIEHAHAHGCGKLIELGIDANAFDLIGSKWSPRRFS
ncbi:hypothetical protein, partial [Leclercia adecarboxylata]|uniref:hypothetical protein n=1 Tax=Leclercia adecarboxylata TaxID=83655 RepID=UPI00234C8982